MEQFIKKVLNDGKSDIGQIMYLQSIKYYEMENITQKQTWTKWLTLSLLIFISCIQEEVVFNLRENNLEVDSYCQQQKKSGIVNDYQYPIVPGMPEWAEFKSHTEMIDACQIPEDFLNNMCTYSLITSCLNYPLRADIFAFNITQMGYDSQKNSFNGLAELHNRPDVLFELIDSYNNFDLPKIVELWDQDKKFNSIDTRMNFHLVGMMLHQTDILGQGDNTIWFELMKIALEKHDFMKNNNHVSWWQAYHSNTTIIGRIMIMSDYQPFKKAMTDDPYLYRLVKNGCQHASYKQVLEIVGYAKEYLKSLEI